jgi:hypothetical protein
MIFLGHVESIEGKISARRILLGKHERKRIPGRSRRRWRIILKWILEKLGEKWTGFICVRIWASGGLL